MMGKVNIPVLSVESLLIGYSPRKPGFPLLTSLNASAHEAGLIAVIGRNGIGKSTLLRTITGLQPALGGNILYSGKNIKDFSRAELAQKVGFISTEIVKPANMSVYELVSLGRFPYTNWIGKKGAADHEIITESLEKTGMIELQHRNVSELSDGERQRAMIARVLAQDTSVIIMDEPTAFLDIKSKYEIVHLLHELAKKKGKTIIFSTHDLNIAIDQADKIWLVLPEGLTEGAPEDLMLRGDFKDLFDSSVVRFNSEDGSFSFRREERGSVFIQGNGRKRFWTEKAVRRAGFSSSDKPCGIVINVPGNDNGKWTLGRSGQILACDSILALIERLTGDDQ